MMGAMTERVTGASRRARVVVAAASAVALAGALLVGGVVTGLVGGSEPACATVAEVSDVDASGNVEALIEAVSLRLKAVAQAGDSDEPGLREAAAVTSLDSALPDDDPLYRNPGDVRFEAVAEWCAD